MHAPSRTLPRCFSRGRCACRGVVGSYASWVRSSRSMLGEVSQTPAFFTWSRLFLLVQHSGPFTPNLSGWIKTLRPLRRTTPTAFWLSNETRYPPTYPCRCCAPPWCCVVVSVPLLCTTLVLCSSVCKVHRVSYCAHNAEGRAVGIRLYPQFLC